MATLPGIVEASYAMPDVHWGYGFPIGGVAATDIRRAAGWSPRAASASTSPAACGCSPPITRPRDAAAQRWTRLMDLLSAAIPARHGPGAVWQPADRRPSWTRCWSAARGTPSSAATASRRIWTAARTAVRSPAPTRRRSSERALERGMGQVGSLGSGNHFLEVQAVDRGLRRAGRRRVRAAAGPGLRDDPLRVARAGPPDLLRPRPR